MADQPFEDATSPVGVTLDGEEPVYRHLNYSAFNFKGVQVGLLYRPIPALRIGLSYRNKVVLEGEGTVKFIGVTLDSTQDVANPHAVRGGVAFSFLNDKALVAAPSAPNASPTRPLRTMLNHAAPWTPPRRVYADSENGGSGSASTSRAARAAPAA